jgi:hypothetical protein
VTVIERAVAAELAAGRLHLRGVFGEARPAVHVDAVVVCGEGRAQTELVAPLREAGVEPLLVGDALRPRRAHDGSPTEPAPDAMRRLPGLGFGDRATGQRPHGRAQVQVAAGSADRAVELMGGGGLHGSHPALRAIPPRRGCPANRGSTRRTTGCG